MSNKRNIKSMDDFRELVEYSFMNTLNCDPQANENGDDYNPREVFSGHYVPVQPTPIENPQYIAHSKNFFKELGFDDSLVESEEFKCMFSADLSSAPEPLKKYGWATGYALSIYGTEYYDQCPFRTGNGYGDGRAISIAEVVVGDKRWEMQLKGAGRTPYCRGADGRAVLRSSIREFLAQEHMAALNIPTSRSLSLYVSKTETVRRPWFREASHSKDPEVMIEELVAISTRVAPSFMRVGQIELFGRRARKNEHPKAMQELQQIVLHLVEREYSDVIDATLSVEEKVLLLTKEFSKRLAALVANWIRVGFTQGNFNSDNTAAGGFTLDYGPFGFMEMFDPNYQPWTGGGVHFSFFNQPSAAHRNFEQFCSAVKLLLQDSPEYLQEFNEIQNGFTEVMRIEMQKMWAAKLGLKTFSVELFNELITLMKQTSVDYTIFFRELSEVPKDIEPLKKSFYRDIKDDKSLEERWSKWLERWLQLTNATSSELCEKLSTQMKLVNPKYVLREWILVEAYKKAYSEDYALVHELQEVMNNPYAEHSKEIEEKYYKKKPNNLFNIAGISHVSCSS